MILDLHIKCSIVRTFTIPMKFYPEQNKVMIIDIIH